MEHFIFDIVSIGAVLIPTVLIIFFIPLSFYLKMNTKHAIKLSTKDETIKFFRRSPKILKIWLRKDPKGKWMLFSRFFFSYKKDNSHIHGQILLCNKKILDIKFYPPEYQDLKGKFPILSANDEFATANGIPNPSNVVRFPKKR